jgi:DNA mismatch endonuclease, patch repair protein
MTDVLTPEQRSRCMSGIRGKHTKPEMLVRRMTHAMGFRYRLHGRGLPGRPDLVFASRKKAIFVHGCFWHMHDCPMGRVTPKTNAEFWAAKRQGNVARDFAAAQALVEKGWALLAVWECQTRDPEKLRTQIRSFLTRRPRRADLLDRVT